MSTIGNFLTSINFFELQNTFLENSYYDILFPFLLVFALLYSVLGNIKLFQSKKTKKPYKSAVFIVSLITSFYGISFETSPGYSVGKLMMMLFPNISALTIGILTIYIVGAILGKDFFKGLFSKKHSSWIYMTTGGIGLGAVLFYVGIAMGFWQYDIIDQTSYWNFIIAAFLLILGIVFLSVGLGGVGILFLFVFGSFVYNYGQGNILEYFIDPFVFIIVIVIILLSWLNSNKEEKTKLRNDLLEAEKNIILYEKEYGRKPKDYESRIYDIGSDIYEDNKKKWKDKYGEEKW